MKILRLGPASWRVLQPSDRVIRWHNPDRGITPHVATEESPPSRSGSSRGKLDDQAGRAPTKKGGSR